ncbi:MAG: hypothetical protein AABX95_00285 [Nanoarchaeota archaeon]
MAEISIKVEVPEELRDKFKLVLTKLVEQFIRRAEFAMADELLKESGLTEEQVNKLADELKKRVAKKHGL